MSREQLVTANEDLYKLGMACDSCLGECCTSRANSMQISQAEAREIRAYLEAHNLWNEDLVTHLRNNIREYRLDVELPRFGARQNLRRTYTCPFYSPGPTGCRLPRNVKPYGCLAFNPTRSGAKGLNDGCTSNHELLGLQSPALPNDKKWPIPVALVKDL